MTKPLRVIKKRGICTVPGCGAVLSLRNVTKVCTNHQHRQPHCMCRKCLIVRKEAVQPAKKGKTVGEGQVAVNIKTNSSTSTANRVVPITLPKPPWET